MPDFSEGLQRRVGNRIGKKDHYEDQAHGHRAKIDAPGHAEIKALRDAASMPGIEEGSDESFIRFCQANARFHLLLVRSSKNQLLENIVMSSLDK
jgi:DNA-binding FadR family transcriptional regulator